MKAVKMRVTENVSAQDIKKHLEGLGYKYRGSNDYETAIFFWGDRYGIILHEDDDLDYFEGDCAEEIFIPVINNVTFLYTKIQSPVEASQQIVNKEVVEDNVNNPSHYTSHKSGIECIDVTRHMSFNLGNATKYIWRCDLKKDAIEDLRKAIFYLNDEIELRLKQKVDFKNVEVL